MTWCIDCTLEDNKLEKARYIYNGNSLCARHVDKRRQNEIEKSGIQEA